MLNKMLSKHNPVKFDLNIMEISRSDVITLEEACRGPFALIFMGLLLSLFILLFELFNKNINL